MMEIKELTCPICEQYCFEESDNFDICPFCSWENDGVQSDDHNYSGGANSLSVNESRIEYFLLNYSTTKKQISDLLQRYNEDISGIYKKYENINHVKQKAESKRMTEELNTNREQYVDQLNHLLQNIHLSKQA